MRRPWFAIGWFGLWGAFQLFAVTSLLAGQWDRPDAFPEGPYRALVYPDLLFIPLYAAAALLLFLRRPSGLLVALFAGGGVAYVMVYLLALADFQGAENLVADGLFFLLNAVAVGQVVKMLLGGRAASPALGQD